MSTRMIGPVTATRHGTGKTNQDRVRFLSNAVAVLDGASSEWPAERDGGWYAEKLASALELAMCDTVATAQALRSILGEAIGVVAAEMGEDRPSSTVGLARWDRDELELLVLGDVTAVVFLIGGEVAVVTDDRLDVVAPELRRAYKENLRAGAGFGAAHRSRLATLQVAQRAMRNVPDGYWIAEADPRAADHAYGRTFPLASVAALLLVTDGVSKAVTHYGLLSWQDVRVLVAEGGPGALFDLIDQAEESDPTGCRWPRGKQKDDKTLAFVAFTHAPAT